VQRARSQIAVALDDEDVSFPLDFSSAAGLWLDRKLGDLVVMLEYDEQAYDYWEMWIAAQKRARDEGERNGALMAAVQEILATTTDLSREGPSANALGRLLTLADFESSAIVRDRLRDIFDDDRVTDHDLWVLTSLLAQLDTAPWFGEELVLPDQAGAMFRGRMRDSITRHWPEIAEENETVLAHGRGIPVDEVAAGRWLSLIERPLAAAPRGDAEELTAQLVLACRINEAAALLAAGKISVAEALMDDLESTLPELEVHGAPAGAGGRNTAPSIPRTLPGQQRPSPLPTTRTGGRTGRIGQALGRDGEWAEAYAEARRKTEEKLKWLRVLRTTAGTDLGPIDAETFVREVYRGSPQDVRSLARAILVEQFPAGPNVSMELLDQFPDAPRNEEISETLSRLTGRVLPPARSEAWPVQARLAAVEHALSLRRFGASAVDDLAELLTDSLARRLALLRHEEAARAAARTPQMAAELLAAAWRDRASSAMSSAPTPDDLPGLERRRDTRRRLASGPIQSLVADQLTVLDYLTYVTVAEQPAQRDAALALLQRSAERRQDATHVLQQAIEVERAVTRMWMVRMALAGGAPAQKEDDS
jgi:hypothetical protein